MWERMESGHKLGPYIHKCMLLHTKGPFIFAYCPYLTDRVKESASDGTPNTALVKWCIKFIRTFSSSKSSRFSDSRLDCEPPPSAFSDSSEETELAPSLLFNWELMSSCVRLIRELSTVWPTGLVRWIFSKARSSENCFKVSARSLEGKLAFCLKKRHFRIKNAKFTFDKIKYTQIWRLVH